MPVFTFYPCRPDGAAASFEAFELDSDDAARERALRMLERHPSCAYVVAWQGDRQVHVETRRAAPRPPGPDALFL